jgi:hypothetical protein
VSDSEEKERQETIDKRAHFENHHFKWLEARAREFDPCSDEGDDVTTANALASDDADRQLWMIWRKWEVLELYAGMDG